MFEWLLGTPKVTRTATALYGRIVERARAPQFYTDLGVADTTEGRFEMIALHLFLALEALKTSSLDRAFRDGVSQQTIEAFVTDMDDCMREMGVGDLTVPKKVKRAAAGFYERTQTYRAALQSDDEAALTAALETFVYGQSERAHSEPASKARALATYTMASAREFAGVAPDKIFVGRPHLVRDSRVETA